MINDDMPFIAPTPINLNFDVARVPDVLFYQHSVVAKTRSGLLGRQLEALPTFRVVPCYPHAWRERRGRNRKENKGGTGKGERGKGERKSLLLFLLLLMLFLLLLLLLLLLFLFRLLLGRCQRLRSELLQSTMAL